MPGAKTSMKVCERDIALERLEQRTPRWRELLRSTALPARVHARRIGQGVEITSEEIRVVRLSCAADDEAFAENAHLPQTRQHLPGERRIRVDDAITYPLPVGVVVGADIVDEAALTTALADCLARQHDRLAALVREGADAFSPAGNARRAANADGEPNGLALAICPSVVMQEEVWLEDLMPGFPMRLPRVVDEAAFDALAPWVVLYAQKISGIDPTDIVVDWYRSAPHDADRITVAVAQRHYLDVRERVAHAAGVSLSAISDAAAAALGACRFVVARCLHAPMAHEGTTALYPAPVVGPRFARPAAAAVGACESTSGSTHWQGVDVVTDAPRDRCADNAYAEFVWSEDTAPQVSIEDVCEEARAALESINQHLASQRFAAVWIGENAWHAWTFDAGGASLEGIALPQSGGARAVVAKLRASAPGPLGMVLVAGERARLDEAGGMRGIGEALGCPAIEFDGSSCCFGPAATPQQLGPTSSVAFGLALRELMR